MMKLIITTIGMGKTSYFKSVAEDEEVGHVPVVDLDFRSPFMALKKGVRYALGKLTQAFAEAGNVDVVLSNPEFINLDALTPGEIEVIFLYPSNVEEVKRRVVERDGDDTFASLIDDQITTMRTMFEGNVARLGAVTAEAESVTEFLNGKETSETEDDDKSEVEEITDPKQEEPLIENTEEGDTETDDKGDANVVNDNVEPESLPDKTISRDAVV